MSDKENLKVPFAEMSAEELQKVAIELEDKAADQEKTAAAQKEKESALNAKSKELDKREKEVAKKEAAPKSSKPEPGLEFEFENENYKFLDSAPKKINVDGKGYSQQEISEDEDLLTALIGGNSGLIVKN